MSARVFTVEEELDFAGHPIIGAAAAAHERWSSDEDERSWIFLVGGREIEVRSRREGRFYSAMMNQGRANLGGSARRLLGCGLPVGAWTRAPAERRDLPVQVVSTGLPYLIVPVIPAGLEEGTYRRRRLRVASPRGGGEVRLRVRSGSSGRAHMGQRRRGRGRRNRERRGSSGRVPRGARPHRRLRLSPLRKGALPEGQARCLSRSPRTRISGSAARSRRVESGVLDEP